MGNYVYVKNTSRSGKLGISRKVFENIVYNVINSYSDAKIIESKRSKIYKYFELEQPIKILFKKDGIIEITIPVCINQKTNAHDLCLSIQKDVSSALQTFINSLAFIVNVEVVTII